MSAAPDPRPRHADPDRDQRLRNSVAEALAAPAALCGLRGCRRRLRCGFYDPQTGLPACIGEASKAQRAIYDDLLGLLLAIDRAVVPGALELWHDRFDACPEIREKQMTCLAILTAILPPGDPLRRDLYTFWRRQRVSVATYSAARSRSSGSISSS